MKDIKNYKELNENKVFKGKYHLLFFKIEASQI